jgi:hypothetical protein
MSFMLLCIHCMLALRYVLLYAVQKSNYDNLH